MRGVTVFGMRKEIQRLGPFDSKKCVNVIVETPKGSRVKYSYQEKTGLFELSKALPEGMMFPFNFGFIPGTEADDGDPLDILIVNEEPLVPGCLLKAKLAGAIKAQQSENGKNIRNDRLIGFAVSKETPTFLESIELNGKLLKEVGHFFVSYNKMHGKRFKVLGRLGPKQAKAIVKKGARAYGNGRA